MRKLVLWFTMFFLCAPLCFADDIIFGVPPWPGVTIKTEVACQIINALGYETEQKEVGPPIIYKTMVKDQMDLYLAAWTPQQNDMLNPLVKNGDIEKLSVNIADCRVGFCVPSYAWNSGVKTIGDLDENGKKFKNTIYNIEPGAAMHTKMANVIKNDIAGLNNWEHLGSSTAAMLSQVKSKIKNKEWVVFGCWSPHWMTIELDIKFLEGVPGTEELTSSSKVFTVANKNFGKRYPEIYKFMKQMQITTDVQSKWIYDYGYKEIEPPVVAEKWICKNHAIIEKWLKNVKSKDGKPALNIIKKTFPASK